MQLRTRILLLFAISTTLLIGAAAFGIWQLEGRLAQYREGVALAQTNSLTAQVIETNFKKQVQEWKDTLLRGKDPAALDKYWSAFHQREKYVRQEAK
jgi:CHASE3 domain sensor protein